MHQTLRLFLLAGLAVFASPQAHARTIQAIKKSGVIRVAADGATPAFNFFQGKKLTGFEVDLAEEIAKRIGVRVEWVVQPFNTLLIGIQQDRFDLIATSHAVTPARQKVVDFLKPHYCTGAVIVSKPGGPKTAKELSGKTVVVPVGTVYFEPLKKLPGIKEIRTVPSETDGLQNLLSGRADAWVTEQFVAFEAIKAHSDAHLSVGETLLPQTNAMVVAKGNGELQKAADEALSAILSNGTYAQLSARYFSRDIRCK